MQNRLTITKKHSFVSCYDQRNTSVVLFSFLLCMEMLFSASQKCVIYAFWFSWTEKWYTRALIGGGGGDCSNASKKAPPQPPFWYDPQPLIKVSGENAWRMWMATTLYFFETVKHWFCCSQFISTVTEVQLVLHQNDSHHWNVCIWFAVL